MAGDGGACEDAVRCGTFSDEDRGLSVREFSDDSPSAANPIHHSNTMGDSPSEMTTLHQQQSNDGSGGDVSADRIAAKLLRENFILTALEFHAELVESGRELPRLRDYFSNPGNFEKTQPILDSSPTLPRTSSVQTFDSLDFARYSDDGERQVDERVAVLEFELRKAKETIKALRANLTVVTESDPCTPEGVNHRFTNGDPIKPHEKRALNFLINEYLLKQSYKLTSITFSDENEDQDFEDWDDVRLNIPKPPELHHLYRKYCKQLRVGISTQDAECQTEPSDECISLESMALSDTTNTSLVTELEKKIDSLKQENENLLAENQTLRKELENGRLSLKGQQQIAATVGTSHVSRDARCDSVDLDGISYSSSDDFTHINADFQVQPAAKGFRDASEETVVVEPSHGEEMIEGNENKRNLEETSNEEEKETEALNFRLLPSDSFLKCLREASLVCQPATEYEELENIPKGVDSFEKLVWVVAHHLPNVIPNVILAKREDLIPIIICTICLHPSSEGRDKLLNVLFNLIKRPQEEQRKMILKGFVTIAQHTGPHKVESELLPQCWEQITHRYPERRLLVAESCGVLAPFVQPMICSSLLLSMAQQMIQEDKEEVVQAGAARSLAALTSYMEDSEKLSQVCELLHFVLQQASPVVVEAGLNVLLPGVASWSLRCNQLEDQLMPRFLCMLEEQLRCLSLMPAEELTFISPDHQVLVLMKALKVLIPFVFVSTVTSGPYQIGAGTDGSLLTQLEVDRLPPAQSPLCDASVILGTEEKLALYVHGFDEYVSKEWFKTWDTYDWVCKNLLPCFVNLTVLTDSRCQIIVHALCDAIRTFCHHFGSEFTRSVVKTVFQERLTLDEEKVTQGQSGKGVLVDATLPVYAAGVFSILRLEEDRKELQSTLQDLLCTLALCRVSSASLEASLIELCNFPSDHELVLAVLWHGVVHMSPLVRCCTAHVFEKIIGVIGETLLSSRVVPALVTLASDPDVSVKEAVIPALGLLLEVGVPQEILDKVYMQFQTFLDDPLYQDHHNLHVEIIRTFARVGPNAESKFRDDFVLPRLAAMAVRNNHTSNETRKTDIALALLEAYTSLSCCFVNDHLIAQAVLPGLRCLRDDLEKVAPQQESVVTAMIQEFETKAESNSIESRVIPSPASSAVSQASGMEEMRSKVTKIFTSRPIAPRPSIPNIFRKK